nr:sulfur carrier protein ThiS [Bacilli bacterium]
MKLMINGQEKTLQEGMTVAALLLQYELLEERIAVEVNGVIVDRQAFSSTVLGEASVVEIVRFVGGG